jgi:hypothetical protein
VVPDISAASDPNTGFRVGGTQVFPTGPTGTYWDLLGPVPHRRHQPVLVLTAGMLAVASQRARRALDFVAPLLYRLPRTAIYDVVAPTRRVHQVRTDYVTGVDPSDGYLFRPQNIDVQISTLHSVPGYDDETGFGTPKGPKFFTAVARLR